MGKIMNKFELKDLIAKIRQEKNKKSTKIETSKEISCVDCRYAADEKLLEKYIKYDNFRDKNYIYLISTLINSFYSTRMGADRLYATAIEFADHGKFIEQILNQNRPMNNTQLDRIQNTLCQKLKLRSTELKLRGEGKEFKSYSFATKFLAIHSKYSSVGEKYVSLFPIYDGQVKTVITKFKLHKIDTIKEFVTKFKFADTEEWLTFYEYCMDNNIKTVCLENYPQFYKLMTILSLATELNFSQLDNLFWKLGDKIQRQENNKAVEA